MEVEIGRVHEERIRIEIPFAPDDGGSLAGNRDAAAAAFDVAVPDRDVRAAIGDRGVRAVG